MDDLVISHVDSDVVTDIKDSLNNRYGGMMLLSKHQGKIREYLGMVFNFSKAQKVNITMYQYLNSLIEAAPDMYKYASREGVGMATQVPSNLYDVRESSGTAVREGT